MASGATPQRERQPPCLWTAPTSGFWPVITARTGWKRPFSTVFKQWLQPPYAADGWRVDVAIAYQREGENVCTEPGRSGRFLIIAHRHNTARPAALLPIAHGGAADGARFTEQFTGQEAIVENGALRLPAHPQGATMWRTGDI